MSVSSVGLDKLIASSGGRSSIHQVNQDFDQLFQALQSGNLDAAQAAYGSFQQMQAGLASSPATQANPVAADWSALGQAIQSGNLASAQDALGKLQNDAKAVWQSHLRQEIQHAQSVYALMQSAHGTSVASGAMPGSIQPAVDSIPNDLSALNLALQTGDTAAAQKLLVQLEQDLHSSTRVSGQN